MPFLSVSDVSKQFGGVTAVDHVTFAVDRGQVVGFLGPNGAGKSTTMRMITQYYEPDTGAITLDGVPLADASRAAKRRIGYLAENNPLYEDMLVHDYLAFIADLRQLEGLPRRQVLDEPTEGLDPNQRVEIRRLIGALGKDRTVILSTHVLSEVQQTCSRLLIINRGKIVADGPVDQLIAQAAGGGTVDIAVEAAGAGVAEALGQLPGVRRVTPAPVAADGRVAVTLTADGSRDLRPEIFALAQSRGWTLYELHQQAGTLEDLFQQLTQKGA